MYCLDTDVLSATFKRSPSISLVRRLSTVPANQQFTTAVNLGEMLFGAAKARRLDLADEIRRAVSKIVVLPFDAQAAEHYGRVRADLEAQGNRLDETDLRIASVALARELVMVTGNVRHFDRIPGLRVENWLTG